MHRRHVRKKIQLNLKSMLSAAPAETGETEAQEGEGGRFRNSWSPRHGYKLETCPVRFVLEIWSGSLLPYSTTQDLP